MAFYPVDLTKNGNIQFAISRRARIQEPFLSIIHLAFQGDYRSGSEGAPDAHYIAGITRTVNEIWRPGALILDLRELNYAWGDEMDLALTPPTDILAIVVGPKCERAISTLSFGVNSKNSVLESPHYFDNLNPAIEDVSKRLVAYWNSKVEEHSSFMTAANLITLDEILESS